MFHSSRARTTLGTIFYKTEQVLLWAFTILLLSDVLLGILARYVSFDVVFADELGKYFFIWLCAIGISAATRDNQHVRLSFIASQLPLSPKAIGIISQTLFLTFSLMLFYLSFRLALMHFVMQKSVMGFHFPMYLFTAALPFGFALNSIRLVQDITRLLKNRPAKTIHTPDEYVIEEQS
jgi:TRAP-type C4-dicarboxylate transport system permease small subunit